MLTGENGVLTKATESKEQTEIGQEKEEITLAYSAAKANKGDKVAELVTADELNAELDKINSMGEASGTEKLTVTFSDTQRQYIIDQSTGKITESVEEEVEDCNDYVLCGEKDYNRGDLKISIWIDGKSIKDRYIELAKSEITDEEIWENYLKLEGKM